MKFALTMACAVALVGAGTGRAEITQSQQKVFKQNLSKSLAIISWWQGKGHWTLFSRHASCSELHGKKQRAVCKYARASMEAHSARVERLKLILYPPEPTYGMMSSICGSSCISCESGWNPNAWNSAGYWGLYQFDYSTWKNHGGSPSMYGKASASEQHRVAANISYDAWPNC